MHEHIHSAPFGVKFRISEMPCLTPHQYLQVTLCVCALSTGVLYLEAEHTKSGEDSDLALARKPTCARMRGAYPKTRLKGLEAGISVVDFCQHWK